MYFCIWTCKCIFVSSHFVNVSFCTRYFFQWNAVFSRRIKLGFFSFVFVFFLWGGTFFFRKVTSLEFLSPLQMFKKKIHFLHSCPCNFLYFQVTKRITWRSLPVNSISIHHVTCWHSFIGSHVGVTIPNLYSSIILHTVNIIAITDFTINVFRFFFFLIFHYLLIINHNSYNIFFFLLLHFISLLHSGFGWGRKKEKKNWIFLLNFWRLFFPFFIFFFLGFLLPFFLSTSQPPSTFFPFHTDVQMYWLFYLFVCLSFFLSFT